MSQPNRRESYVVYDVGLSRNDMAVVIDGFRVSYHPLSETPVSLRGSVGFKIEHGDPQTGIRAADKLRPMLSLVGVLLQENCSRRGNEGPHGTMVYRFDETSERAKRGFKNPEEALVFIHQIVDALGCLPLIKWGNLEITRAFEVRVRENGEWRWVSEDDWLLRSTHTKLVEERLVSAFTNARPEKDVIVIVFGRTFDSKTAEVLAGTYGVAFLFSPEDRRKLAEIRHVGRKHDTYMIRFELHGPMTTGARQIARVLAPHVESVSTEEQKNN